MQKYIFLVVSIIFSNLRLTAQNTFPASGNVGIGTTTPQAQLHIVGDAQFDNASWFSRSGNGDLSAAIKMGQTRGSGGLPNVTLSTKDTLGLNTLYWESARYSHIVQFRKASPTGLLETVHIGGIHDNQNYITIYGTDGITPKIRLSSDLSNYMIGNLAIGTTDPKGYKLAVAGNMIAEKVKVKLQSNWPDYVFDSSYQLPSLKQIEIFISKNKHLPDIPSIETVQKEGIDLGDSQVLLLKKIEELTLYLIEQNKRIEQLENTNKELILQNQEIKSSLQKFPAMEK